MELFVRAEMQNCFMEKKLRMFKFFLKNALSLILGSI